MNLITPENIRYIFGGILILIIYVIFKVWTFSRDVRGEILKIIKEFIISEDFKDSILKMIKTDIEKCIYLYVKNHNEASEAHSGYRRMNDGFIRAHVAEEMTKHNENKVAHNIAFEEYPDRRELNGAIGRLEDKITSEGNKIIARIEVLSVKMDQSNGQKS